ncbi:MAG: hypothetical protein COZ57_32810, partial [Armatimonadetes bacterium CG_4_8_14_3_um_filter_66_20]
AGAAPGRAPADVTAKWVVADGIGANENRARARDEALNNAREAALAEGVGLFVRSEVQTENSRLLSSKVYTLTQGFVGAHEVLSEKWEPDNVCRVTINAPVFLGKVADALVALGDQLRLVGNPRVVLAIQPPTGAPQLVREATEGTLRQLLKDERVNVVDAATLSQEKQRRLQNLRRLGEPEAADALELLNDVDLVLTGSASVVPQGQVTAYGIKGRFSSRAAVDLRAVCTATGQVLASYRAEAAHTQSNQDAASEIALSNAAREWMARGLGAVKLALCEPAQCYQLTVAGAESTAAVDQLVDALLASRFAREVPRRAFNAPVADVDVLYVGTADGLRRELEDQKAVPLQVKETTWRTLTLKLLPAQPKGG